MRKPRLLPVERFDLFRKWLLSHSVFHSLSSMYAIDFLPCPRCAAVGTFKPREAGNGRPRRWLCKYCGLYFGPDSEGTLECHPCSKTDAWSLPQDSPREPTPWELVTGSHAALWPWA